ncbi:MAG: hypothetical protein ACLPPF_00765 [Rhodomicrobium sp.]
MTGPSAFISDPPIETAPRDIAEIERTLGTALRDFASELRLADAADFAAFIRIGHMPNLRSMVQSSAELHFKPGTLELSEPGELELGWFAPPLVTLPMKFRHRGVRVYFRLQLAALSAAIEVESIAADGAATGAELNGRLAGALEAARITRPVQRRDRAG